jgi:hypothetical protein
MQSHSMVAAVARLMQNVLHAHVWVHTRKTSCGTSFVTWLICWFEATSNVAFCDRCTDAQEDDGMFKPATQEEEELFQKLEVKVQQEAKERSARRIYRWFRRMKDRMARTEEGESIRRDKLCSNMRLAYVKKMTGF